jgi:uncharacterized damage-inducible protein DinB
MNMNIQYDLVISSRNVLLDYCQLINNKDFLLENSNFGRGSIRNLLVHICNTYEFWIGHQALKKDIQFKKYDTITSVREVEKYFEKINDLIEEFIAIYKDHYLEELSVNINNKNLKANPLKLFIHVITHEFHHKGQILSLSRHLGYIPVDTDVIR